MISVTPILRRFLLRNYTLSTKIDYLLELSSRTKTFLGVLPQTVNMLSFTVKKLVLKSSLEKKAKLAPMLTS